MTKKPKTLERYYKGVSNHHRIEILMLLQKTSGLTLTEIADTLKCNFKTMSEHTKRLHAAGLIQKEYRGNYVMHYLSPYGEKMVKSFSLFDK